MGVVVQQQLGIPVRGRPALISAWMGDQLETSNVAAPSGSMEERWDINARQTALSTFFQESGIPYSHPHHQMMCTPANTPATPPSFPEALAMFSRLKASEAAASPPLPPPPLPQPGGFPWPACSLPGQPGAWTASHPLQPAGWPGSLSQQGSSEPKTSATLEAER
ncbi:UBA-like domain-containing protein 1 isoform X1 [Podarcis muralis]